MQKIGSKGSKSWYHFICNGIEAKIERFYQKSGFLFKAQYVCDFDIKRPIQLRPSERADQDVSEYVWHMGVGSYFFPDIGCQSQVT